jgi:hypothetical protein
MSTTTTQKAKTPGRTIDIKKSAPFVKAAPLPSGLDSEPKYTLLGQADAVVSELATLQGSLDNLARIIGPVMVDVADAEECATPHNFRMSSPLGAQLEQIQLNIAQLTYQVDALASRVELV